MHDKPLSIPAEDEVLKACLQSWFYTRMKTGSEETGFRRSLFAGHVSESKFFLINMLKALKCMKPRHMVY